MFLDRAFFVSFLMAFDSSQLLLAGNDSLLIKRLPFQTLFREVAFNLLGKLLLVAKKVLRS